MIIVKTPYRVSFFGGGTDYEQWYSRYGGLVLTCTINKYCCVIARKMPAFLGSKYRIFWAKAETPNTIEEIQHPGVRGCLQYMGLQYGIEVNHAGDLPARTGLGSSSSFTVGMLNALHIIEGENIDKATLAKEAIEVEQKVLKETVGIQDQIQCAWGGVNKIKIESDGNYHINPIMIDDKETVQDHLLLFFTGLQRTASDIAQDQIQNMEQNKDVLNEIAELVEPARKALIYADMKEFGRLLHESWECKKTLSSKITTSEINEIYEKGIKAGAYGGKVLGAGGGGFILFCVPPEKKRQLIDTLNLLWIPLEFEYRGSHVL